MSRILMAHQVAGYPDDATALEVARALVEGGTKILEIQLAFSDPSADGVAIQTACSTVLQGGYTVRQGLDYIRRVHSLFPELPIFLMTYASLAYRPGIEGFVRSAVASGVSGFIIPDLPFDYDEGLGAACKMHGALHIPVAAPSMTKERLHKMATAGYEYIYTSLRAGITGGKTVVTEEMLAFLDAAGEGGSRLLGGFGITNAEQACAIQPHVHAVVAGSVFVNIITRHCSQGKASLDVQKMSAEIREKAGELSGC